jgi:hypothetical protein
MRKTVKTMLLTSGVVTAMLSIGCSKTVEEKAAKAAKEYCKCIKDNSIQTCEDRMRSDYMLDFGKEEFQREFERVNDCGAYFYKKQ